MGRTRALLGLVVGLTGFGAFAGTAGATGAANISSASPVQFGQQEFGNTATDGPNTTNDSCPSWWSIPALAGDSVTVNWQSTLVHQGNDFPAQTAKVFPSGTTDYSLSNASSLQEDGLGNTGFGQLSFTASAAGSYPLEFFNGYCEDGGPYSFVAYETHAIVLATRVARNRRSHTTSIVVSTFHPSGDPITGPVLTAALQEPRVPSGWTTLKSAYTPVILSKRWPKRLKGKHESLRVVVSGPSYRTVTRRIRVVVP